MKNFKKKIISIIVVLGFAMLSFICLMAIANSVSGSYETQDIYVARKEIPKFTKITESNFDEYFELKNNINTSIVTEDIIVDKEDLVGLYCIENIHPTTTLSKQQFMKEKMKLSEYKKPYEFSLAVDSFSDAASGTIREGDYVRIYTLDNSNSSITEVSNKLLYVSAAFDSSGKLITAGDTESVATSFNFFIEESEEQELYANLCDKKVILVKQK